jgi:hypothetical protein
MLKSFAILSFLLISFCSIRAQTPYSWSFTATKTADKIYEIHCTMDVSSPWHTYSQFTPDGGPVPTKFTFSKSPLYILEGTTKENGKMVTKHEAVFGVDVKYFDGKVDFVQVIKLKASAKTNFTGSVTFMVCNDEQCLPPKTVPINLALN